MSTLQTLNDNGLNYIFTDSHAVTAFCEFYDDPIHLDKLDWSAIRTNKWGSQYGPNIRSRKQAECLVYRYVPLNAFRGLATIDEEIAQEVSQILTNSEINMRVRPWPSWYY